MSSVILICCHKIIADPITEPITDPITDLIASDQNRLIDPTLGVFNCWRLSGAESHPHSGTRSGPNWSSTGLSQKPSLPPPTVSPTTHNPSTTFQILTNAIQKRPGQSLTQCCRLVSILLWQRRRVEGKTRRRRRRRRRRRKCF